MRKAAISGEKTTLPDALKARGSVCPIGAYGSQNGTALTTVNSAVAHIIAHLNAAPAQPDPTLTTRERNIIIRARYAAGVSQADLARQFGISYQRVWQIVHGKRK